MRFSGAWLPLLFACAACGGDDSTASGTPSDATIGTGSGTGGGGNSGASVTGPTGGLAGTMAGTGGSFQGGAGAVQPGGAGDSGGAPGSPDASVDARSAADAAKDVSAADAAKDVKTSGPCTGSADCNGATCCGGANNARMCVASPAQCTGLIYCKVPMDCPEMDHCCPQGFCGGCD